MRKSHNVFKRPPKKYQPKGLAVVYEDRDILVVDKISGILTVPNNKVKDNTAYNLLTKYVQKGNSKSKNRLFVVHRLDKDSSGILVFAKNHNAKRFLQKEWPGFIHRFYAVIEGMMLEKEGVITSYLAENSIYKMYSVNDPQKGKLASTAYKVIRESNRYSLLEIELKGARKNQVRVHLAERGFPIVGDRKYGQKEKGIKRLALHAGSVAIVHPFSNDEMIFEAILPVYFKKLMEAG